MSETEPLATVDWRDAAARIIGCQINSEPWWWKARFDDDHEPTAVRLRDENRAAVNAIIEAGLPYNERLEYDERILAAEMEVIRIKREVGLQVERPFADCCAEAGGHVDACDCVNKDHGTAWFDVHPSLAALSPPADDASDVKQEIAVDAFRAGHSAAMQMMKAMMPVDMLEREIRRAWERYSPPRHTNPTT